MNNYSKIGETSGIVFKNLIIVYRLTIIKALGVKHFEIQYVTIKSLKSEKINVLIVN